MGRLIGRGDSLACGSYGGIALLSWSSPAMLKPPACSAGTDAGGGGPRLRGVSGSQAPQGGARCRRPWLIVIQLLSMLGVLILPVLFMRESSGQSPEYRVKAGFIYNLMRFTEWPNGAFRRSDDPLRVCVFGENPFGHYLESIAGPEVGGRRVTVDQTGIDGIEACHVIFISRSSQMELRLALDRLDGRPVLTIGDMDDFAAEGGAVNLVTRRGKVRLEVNPDAVKRAGLTLSSAVLRLATIVR